MRVGHKFISIEIDGKGVEKLQNEAGGHRIQRIPNHHNKKGTVHSSTVTVAILSEEKSKSIYDKRNDTDLRIEWFSGTGCGGQFRNKHQNSCRLIHIPSGIVRQAQTRSRENSLTDAKKALFDELDRLSESINGQAVNHVRKACIGSGERSDKRRTYRFQDDLVHDHINNKSACLKKVLKGNFDLLW